MKRFWNAQDVADYLGFSVRKVRDDDARGLLPAPVRFGRLKRWDAEELARWCNAGCPARAQWERMRRDQKDAATVAAANAS
ncbi:MAG: helix-turn-helix transcriptional regulator [Planctomycetota bacterium]|jgi:predicted DNA-binding transcriptional regulator AlpA